MIRLDRLGIQLPDSQHIESLDWSDLGEVCGLRPTCGTWRKFYGFGWTRTLHSEETWSASGDKIETRNTWDGHLPMYIGKTDSGGISRGHCRTRQNIGRITSDKIFYVTICAFSFLQSKLRIQTLNKQNINSNYKQVVYSTDQILITTTNVTVMQVVLTSNPGK